MTSHDLLSLDSPAQPSLIFEHDCPYEGLIEQARKLGRGGLAFSRRANLIRAEVHEGNVCPPTHIDGYPTREWADATKDIRQ